MSWHVTDCRAAPRFPPAALADICPAAASASPPSRRPEAATVGEAGLGRQLWRPRHGPRPRPRGRRRMFRNAQPPLGPLPGPLGKREVRGGSRAARRRPAGRMTKFGCATRRRLPFKADSWIACGRGAPPSLPRPSSHGETEARGAVGLAPPGGADATQRPCFPAQGQDTDESHFQEAGGRGRAAFMEHPLFILWPPLSVSLRQPWEGG